MLLHLMHIVVTHPLYLITLFFLSRFKRGTYSGNHLRARRSEQTDPHARLSANEIPFADTIKAMSLVYNYGPCSSMV